MYTFVFCRYLDQEMSVRVPSSSSSRYPVQQMASSYMCRYCAKQLVSMRDMQLHVLQHSRGNAPLNCAICNKSYRTPSKLQRHVRVHSGERPYICNLCGRRFTRSDHLKQHMKVHSPNRQKNMCRLCNARFTSCHLLASHLRTHEIHQIHLCRCCGEGFPTSDELDRHKKLHDVKGNIRASRGHRSTIHPIIADPRLGMVNPKSGSSLHSEQETLNEKPNLHGSKWIGCARFCLSQIPPESSNNSSSNNDNNDNFTGNDDNNNNRKSNDNTETEALKSIIGSDSLNNNDWDDHNNNDKPSRRVEMRLSPDHDQEQPINVNDDSGSFEVEIIAEDLRKDRRDTGEIENKKLDCTNRPKTGVSPLSNQFDPGVMTSLLKDSHNNRLRVSEHFNKPLLSSVSCDDNYQSTVTRSNIPYPLFKSSSESLKALIKRESQRLEPNNMTYTHNLLGVPSSLTRPFYMTSHFDPRLQFSPYPISAAYLDLMYHINTTNKSNINITANLQQLSDMSSSGTRCEHCHIWFEDSAMFMLHNSLHSADDADPFTCKKCMKKMGNRLEFTAHLVWHLNPVIVE